MGAKPPPKRGAGGKTLQFRLLLCLYRWSSMYFIPFYSPHPKSPVPTCGPPRLLGGFKGLSRINISSAAVFYPFLGEF